MALSFNLQGALQATLNPSLCGAGSSGACAKSVRIFLEHGGLYGLSIMSGIYLLLDSDI